MPEPEREMITFARDNRRFSMRVVAIIIRGDEVLVNRAIEDDFWVLPGGRAELLEPASVGLARELREELGVEAEIGELALVAENLFDYATEHYHSVEFFFRVSLPSDSEALAATGAFEHDENGKALIFQWFPIQRLNEVKLYPLFLREKLPALSPGTEYILSEEKLRGESSA